MLKKEEKIYKNHIEYNFFISLVADVDSINLAQIETN